MAKHDRVGSGVKTERNFGTGPGRPRIKEVLTKQQVTWRYDRTASAPSHKLATIGEYKKLWKLEMH